MYLKKLDIKGFGRLENCQYILKPGLNVIYGSNESGKSTIQAFIKGMLYGLKGGRRAKDGKLPPLKQYKPWVAPVYGGLIECELDNGQQYTISRNFDKNTITVHDTHNNNVTGDFSAGKEEGAKFAEQYLGLSERCFERTAFIGQLQSVVDGEGKKILAERLMNMRQSGDEEVSYHKAYKALKDAQLSFVGSERSTTRPLNIIHSMLDEAVIEEEKKISLHESGMNTFLDLDRTRREETMLKEQLKQMLDKRNILKEQQKVRELEQMISKLSHYRIQIEELENLKQINKNALDKLRSKKESIRGFKNFSRNDAEKMVQDNTLYVLIQKQYQELMLKKEQNEEKLTDVSQFLISHELFTKNESKIEEVLNDVVYKEHEHTNNSQAETAHKRLQWVHLGKRIRWSILCMSLMFLLVSGICIFRDILPPGLFMACLLLGVMFILFSGGVFLHTKRKKRQWSVENEVSHAVTQAENKKHLEGWMKEVNVAHLHDFIRLRELIEEKKRLCQDLKAESAQIENDGLDLSQRMESVKTDIIYRLCEAGIQTKADTFNKEHIQAWKEGLEAYQNLMSEQQALDKETVLLRQKEEGVYRELSLFSGETIRTCDFLVELIDRKKKELSTKEQKKINEKTALDQIEEKIIALQNQIIQNQLQINTLATRLEHIPDEESLQQVHEKIQELTEEKEKRIFIGKALNEAMMTLNEASIEIQRDYVPSLSLGMGHILSIITRGKYNEVKSDDRLQLNLLPGESLERVTPEQLSSGTVDQIYFAMRLASVRLIEKENERLPLFLDEPFSQYDAERTKDALTLLSEECRRRQILFFTCRPSEVELIQSVFDSINIIELT